MRSNRLFDYKQVLRFGLVGVLNTATGYSIILVALWLGWGDIAANMTGYAFGLVVSFFLNSQWTFAKAEYKQASLVVRYILAFLFAYAANLVTVIVIRSMDVLDGWAIHLIGIIIYTALFYLASVYFVFSKSPARSDNETRALSLQNGSR
ncbi:GtrA family protein [Phyllobacterium sp. 628]|uniref:GtrA family protein n=1 Tax=Phyllobacterium sp. 628 TaxID=2718938 RepID=UPI001FCEF253|nr:GtrA family protein [Phyllobacterium sp. 628]